MCLSIPAKVLKIEGNTATVSVGGAQYSAGLDMVDDVVEGDYVLIHTGFAIQKISEEEARKTLETFREFSELNKELDREESKSGKRIV